MNNNLTIIIGAGAAGIVAAINSKRNGKEVLICERLGQIGKKILASGNGRCNLANENLSHTFYKNSSQPLVKSIFSKFSKDNIISFFDELGLKLYSKEGKIFPMTNEASCVLKVLEIELKRLKIPIELNFTACKINYTNSIFTIKSKEGKTLTSKKIILTGGGKSYPSLGSDGSCYLLAKTLGHNIIEPVPSTVPLLVKDPICHLLQGQKISAKARSMINGKISKEISGDLLFTKYGLSGTVILDISEEISIAINRENKKDIKILIDMLPSINNQELEKEISLRLNKNLSLENFFIGLLPNRLALALKDIAKIKDAKTIVEKLKNKIFSVQGTRGWNEAEFTSGGIDIKEIKEYNLESKLIPNLYFAGEILDVGGIRGGYHLAWAWASGLAVAEENN